MSELDATPILAVQGAANDTIQSLLMAFARRWSASGVRIVGAVEEPASECAVLRDLANGRTYAVHQDLGAGSTACRLDGSGIADACEAIRRQILAGCDLVVLSKFGKLEAGRSGFVAAFTAAAEARIPILTAVSPAYLSFWQAFAGTLATTAPPSMEALDGWWRTQGGALDRPRSGDATVRQLDSHSTMPHDMPVHEFSDVPFENRPGLTRHPDRSSIVQPTPLKSRM